MFEAVNIKDIVSTLECLREREEFPPQGRLLVGILFTRPGLPLAKTDIIPHLEYLHRRTELHMHFFCPGFAFNDLEGPCSYWEGKDYENLSYEKRHNISHSRLNYYFSDSRLISCINEFEVETRWKYSGESDLLIVQAKVNKKVVELDFESAIACNLRETLMREKITPSLPEFFEKLIRDAKPVHNYTNNQDLTYRISDVEGWRYGSRSIAEWILSLVPGNKYVKKNANLIDQLRIRDISVKQENQKP